MAFWSQAANLTPLVLFVANADGSDARPINGADGVVGGPLGAIAWSPDGTRIAFASAGDDGSNAIYIAAVDGSGTKGITPPDGADRNSPAWSPSGDLIAWRRTPAGAQESDLFVAAPDGSGERRLVTSQAGGAVFAAPQWSPDGSRLAYARLENSQLVAAIVDLHGHEEVLSEPWEDASPPVWSNDGTRLAYSRYPAGAVIVDVASDAKTELPTGLAECGIAWSPDDTTLLGLGANCHDGVYRIPVAHPEIATRISQLPGEVVVAGWQRVAP